MRLYKVSPCVHKVSPFVYACMKLKAYVRIDS